MWQWSKTEECGDNFWRGQNPTRISPSWYLPYLLSEQQYISYYCSLFFFYCSLYFFTVVVFLIRNVSAEEKYMISTIIFEFAEVHICKSTSQHGGLFSFQFQNVRKVFLSQFFYNQVLIWEKCTLQLANEVHIEFMAGI